MAEPNQLVNLESCLTAGAVFYGSAVRSVRIETADGRVQRLMLPIRGFEPDEPEPMPTAATTPAERSAAETMAARIVEILGTLRPGAYLGGPALAAQIEPMLTPGDGTFKRAVKLLKAGGPDDPAALIDSDKRLGYYLIPGRKP